MAVKVKICGLTNLADAHAALAAGADMLGFIFFPKSPRYITPERAREIIQALKFDRRPPTADQGQYPAAAPALAPERTAEHGKAVHSDSLPSGKPSSAQPPFGIVSTGASVGGRLSAVVTVGVFVDESSATVAQILDFCGLDLAQLHGEEPPEMVMGDLHGRSYKALRPRSLDEASDLASQYAPAPSLRPSPGSEDRRPALLVDAYHPHLRGGTGETGDWSLAAALAGRYPLLLAGGLCPANVVEAVRAVRPWGVDVSSGVESAPGQKDHAAVRAFVAAAKGISDQPSAVSGR
jgi:phosphoribosylanthranilate isomerase